MTQLMGAERGIKAEGWEQTEMNSWRGSVGSTAVRVFARTVNMFIYVHIQMSQSVKLYLLFLRTFCYFLLIETVERRLEMWERGEPWHKDAG